MCVETSWLAEMATDTFSIEAIVRGYHVKQDSWDAAIGEQLPCKREPGNYKDPFTVAVVITCYCRSCAQESMCSVFLPRIEQFRIHVCLEMSVENHLDLQEVCLVCMC